MKRYFIGICSEKSGFPLDCKFTVIEENPLAYHFRSDLGRFDFWVNKGYLQECIENRVSLHENKLHCFIEKDI